MPARVEPPRQYLASTLFVQYTTYQGCLLGRFASKLLLTTLGRPLQVIFGANILQGTTFQSLIAKGNRYRDGGDIKITT